MTNPINALEVPISSHALPLHSIAARPMPSGVRGALVQRVSVLPDGPLDVTWLAAKSPRLPLGRIRLRWEPASSTGWNVTAHLGLATAEVHLASWHAAPHDWPLLVRPTIHEVLGLCAALTVATAALDLSNRLAQV
ncbi:esterase [Streptomyces sp. NPDC053728]|uniref:esterase n=1 Tax=Streptomyces sp. NPDC053728 TaxID=3155534 RepID=UPI00344821E6